MILEKIMLEMIINSIIYYYNYLFNIINDKNIKKY